MKNGTASSVIEVVVTGGPCGGKTSALAALSEAGRDCGYDVFTVPEIATLAYRSGVMDLKDAGQHLGFQQSVLRWQMRSADVVHEMASVISSKPTVIIHDRGPMDAVAFSRPEDRTSVLRVADGGLYRARDRFAGVIHMKTAADGAEEHYSRLNNEARSMHVGEARAVDQELLRAWTGTPHLYVVGNHSDGFHGKLSRSVEAFLHAIGEPEPTEYEQKFLVEALDDHALENLMRLGAQPLSIVQHYLSDRSNSEQHRVRMRSAERYGCSSISYTETTKQPHVAHGSKEIERTIDEHAFEKMARGSLRTIRKTRWVFVEGDQYFELDRIDRGDLPPVWILEAETVRPDDAVEPPGYLSVIANVTCDRAYSNSMLAVDQVS